MRPSSLPLALPAAALPNAALLGGCADAVDPTLGTDRAFSLYGYLDPTADRQAVRVVPIADAIGADTARTIAAAVSSVEPATGRTATWRDSVVTYAEGTVGHVFVANYTPTAGTTVELRVAETAGERRVATVALEVPPLTRPEVAAPTAARRRSASSRPSATSTSSAGGTCRRRGPRTGSRAGSRSSTRCSRPAPPGGPRRPSRSPSRTSGSRPTRSPDGDPTTWRPGLLPTRGAPNAAVRFAAR